MRTKQKKYFVSIIDDEDTTFNSIKGILGGLFTENETQKVCECDKHFDVRNFINLEEFQQFMHENPDEYPDLFIIDVYFGQNPVNEAKYSKDERYTMIVHILDHIRANYKDVPHIILSGIIEQLFDELSLRNVDIIGLNPLKRGEDKQLTALVKRKLQERAEYYLQLLDDYSRKYIDNILDIKTINDLLNEVIEFDRKGICNKFLLDDVFSGYKPNISLNDIKGVLQKQYYAIDLFKEPPKLMKPFLDDLKSYLLSSKYKETEGLLNIRSMNILIEYAQIVELHQKPSKFIDYLVNKELTEQNKSFVSNFNSKYDSKDDSRNLSIFHSKLIMRRVLMGLYKLKEKNIIDCPQPSVYFLTSEMFEFFVRSTGSQAKDAKHILSQSLRLPFDSYNGMKFPNIGNRYLGEDLWLNEYLPMVLPIVRFLEIAYLEETPVSIVTFMDYVDRIKRYFHSDNDKYNAYIDHIKDLLKQNPDKIFVRKMVDFFNSLGVTIFLDQL